MNDNKIPSISVIVPVYNVQKYLPSCIDSILSQTFQDFELIIIDDGSTDGSSEICDVYEKSSDKVRVIHQSNKGVSCARNAGINIARGKYLSFIDADDSIEKEMYQTMVDIAENGNYDIVGCGMKHFDEDGSLLYKKLEGEFILDQFGMLSSLFQMPDPLGGSACNKIFLFKKIQSLRFKEGCTMSEDRLYLFDVYSQMTCCKKISNGFYHVLERQNSASRSRSVSQIMEIIENSYHMIELSKKHTAALQSKAVIKFMDDCLRYIPEIKNKEEKDKKNDLEVYRRIKLLMWKVLLKAMVKKQLSLHQLHGYLKAM